MILQRNYLADETIETIYFGGGTPSLLEPSEVDGIMNELHKHYKITGGAEVTFEANPDDITMERLAAWRQSGINRLSMGVQSFYEDDLRWMNRAHSAGQALQSVRMVQDAGFDNLTIDLIYGSPGLDDAKWEHNVQTALDLLIPHISCYALTVEPQTALAHLINKNQSPPVQSEDQARQFLLLMDWLNTAGYEHYEISNFSKPGMHSRHNSAYWSGAHYLGLGPSAHSFNGVTRQWNIANNAKYIRSLSGGILPFEVEELTLRDLHNEFLMISLRKKEGIDKKVFEEKFGLERSGILQKNIRKYINNGSVTESNSSYHLTRQGKLFADGIAADLFS